MNGQSRVRRFDAIQSLAVPLFLFACAGCGSEPVAASPDAMSVDLETTTGIRETNTANPEAISPNTDLNSPSGFPLGSHRVNFGVLEREAKSCNLARWSVKANAPLFGDWCDMTADLPAPIDDSAWWQIRQAWEEPKASITVNSREVVGAAIEDTLAEAMAKRSDEDKAWDAHTSEREFDHEGLQFKVHSSVSQDPEMSFVRVSFTADSK